MFYVKWVMARERGYQEANTLPEAKSIAAQFKRSKADVRLAGDDNKRPPGDP